MLSQTLLHEAGIDKLMIRERIGQELNRTATM